MQYCDLPEDLLEHENRIERTCPNCEKDSIDANDIQLPEPDLLPEAKDGSLAMPDLSAAKGNLEHFLESIEKQAIERALEETRWNKTAAAKKLGISFRALRYRLQKLGME